MFNKNVVYEALKRSVTSDPDKRLKTGNNSIEQDSLISLLIHDIFGGEILKTHTKKNWHFYNRIDGERVDFANHGNTQRLIQIPGLKIFLPLLMKHMIMLTRLIIPIFL